MRPFVIPVSVLCAACFAATCAIAQSGQWGQAEDQIPPYHTHTDRRHGHDHEYPDRGVVIRDLPRGTTAVNYAGISYRFAGGVWYEPLGPVFVVVTPPIGLIVPQLPVFATTFETRGKPYLYANDVFYRPRPELGGYEVVNDPEDALPLGPQAPAVASPALTPASLPIAAAQPHVVPEATPPSVSAAPPSAGSAAPTSMPPSTPTPTPTSTPMPTPTPTPSPGQPPALAKSSTAPPATPPAVPSSVAPVLANPTRVAISPRNGQTTEQQASDRYVCYRFAVAQSGFDPLAPSIGTPSVGAAQSNAEYSQAQAACLEGRGYAVK